MVFKLTKNLLHVVFLLILGWFTWSYISPYFFSEGTSVPEAVDAMNESFREQAVKDVDKNTREIGNRLAQKVTQGVGKQYDKALELKGIESWGQNSDKEQEPQLLTEILLSSFAKFFAKLKYLAIGST